METLFERTSIDKAFNSTQCSTLYLLTEWAFIKTPHKVFFENALDKSFIDFYIKEIFLKEIILIDNQASPSEEDVDIQLSQLILKLIREFLIKLDFTDGLAFDLLESWQKSERLIFVTKSSYREHFIHQFYDFLGGCLFINKLWESIKRNEPLKIKEKKDFKPLTERQFLRRWFFAAMFHDIGYPAETLSDLKSHLNLEYFNKVPNYEVRKLDYETFEPDQNFAKLIHNIARIHLFSEEVSLLESHSNELEKHHEFEYSLNELKNLLTDEIKQTHDHGVTGAIFFLKTALIDMREIVLDPNDGKTVTDIEYNTLLNDLLVSAAAIAGHNLRIHTYKSYTIDFSTRPIAGLLELSDDLQEWNRRKSSLHKSRISLSDRLNLFRVELDNSNDEIVISYSLKNEKDDFSEYKFQDVENLFYVNLSDYYNYFFRRISIKLVNEKTKAEKKVITAELYDNSKPYLKHKQGRYRLLDLGIKNSVWLD